MKIISWEFKIFEVNAPVEGKQEETNLQGIIGKATETERLILAGDFNARIGNKPFNDCVGSEGEGTISSDDTGLTDFVH